MSDLTLVILQEIRDEIVGLRRDTNAKFEETNARLDETNVRLGRVEQGLIDLGRFTQGLALDMNRYERWHHHVDRLGDQVEDLTERVVRLEARPASGPPKG